ncbi:hypothetical protein B0T22DRAFT_150076 [Podospora appendiculata]|uniref:Uncharacterized protein n=1 Tax=Podospora appendiculata TaxID=314037 RepID=A0AAE0X909_9PEZI|nr:hypothetical protein B0T22DRAFT_150076 [Podospora appendiculata]
MSPMTPVRQQPAPVSVTPASHDAQSKTTGSPTAWAIPAVISSVIIVAAILLFIVYGYIKRRQYRKARQSDPYLSRDGFIPRRKLSEADQFEEEERQRKIMIRKSLASRSWSSAESRSMDTSSHVEPREAFEVDEEEPQRLKDDWKAWEARIHRERSMSGELHPAACQMLDLPMSPPSRSPSRSPLLQHPSSPLASPTSLPVRLAPH